jgi:predicted nucleotidyltransferase
MQHNIVIDPQSALIVHEILNRFLGDELQVWVFGSRATNTAKKFSDLDLALEAKNNKPIDSKLILNLEQAFEESNLPWKVDIIDMNDITQTFRNIIEQDKILLR